MKAARIPCFLCPMLLKFSIRDTTRLNYSIRDTTREGSSLYSLQKKRYNAHTAFFVSLKKPVSFFYGPTRRFASKGQELLSFLLYAKEKITAKGKNIESALSSILKALVTIKRFFCFPCMPGALAWCPY